MPSYTKSKLSDTSGEPVDVIVRTVRRSWLSIGRTPALCTASMYLADVPKRVIPASSAKSNSAAGAGCIGEPSHSSTVAPEPSAVTSQFHIIQPHVVK